MYYFSVTMNCFCEAFDIFWANHAGITAELGFLWEVGGTQRWFVYNGNNTQYIPKQHIDFPLYTNMILRIYVGLYRKL